MRMTLCLAMLAMALSPCSASEGSTSDTLALASGYARAFQEMSPSSVTITYNGASGLEPIKDVKDIKAFGGALLIRTFTGNQQILDAGRVVRISGN